MKPAGMAARATAVLIDSVLVFFGLGTFVALATGQTRSSGGTVGFDLHGWPALLWVVLSLGYWAVLERVWGTTIGKRLFSIRVVSADGGALTWRHAIVRNLLRPVDGFPYVLPYLVGFIVAMTSSERLRLGDRAAGSRVVGG